MHEPAPNSPLPRRVESIVPRGGVVARGGRFAAAAGSLLVCVLVLLGCGGSGEQTPSATVDGDADSALPAEYQALEVPAGLLDDAAAKVSGQARYGLYCAPCHGNDGRGKPFPSAPAIGQDLTDAAWRDRVSPKSVFHVIREGKPGTAMDPIRLGDAETWELVAYVLSLADSAVDPAVDPAAEAGVDDSASPAPAS